MRRLRRCASQVTPWPVRATQPIFSGHCQHGADLIGTPEASVFLQLALITLTAATLQGAAGFGFGLLALPGYLWALSSMEAVPLVVIVNLGICTGLAAKLRRDVHLAVLRWMVAGALVGLPVGLFAFRRVGSDQLMLVVSTVVLISAVLLARRKDAEAPRSGEDLPFRRGSAVGAGLVAGAMTVALGIPGPPVVLYLTSIAAAKDTLRATALTFFAASYLASLILQAAVVGIASGVWVTAALLLPLAAAGGLVGNWLSHHVREDVFRRVTLVLIVVAGASTLVGVLLR